MCTGQLKGIVTSGTKFVELKIAVLTYIRHAQKDRYHRFSPLYVVGKTECIKLSELHVTWFIKVSITSLNHTIQMTRHSCAHCKKRNGGRVVRANKD